MPTMMAASVSTDDGISIGEAEALFPLGPVDGAAALTGAYDVAADGRFLMARRQRQPDARELCQLPLPGPRDGVCRTRFKLRNLPC